MAEKAYTPKLYRIVFETGPTMTVWAISRPDAKRTAKRYLAGSVKTVEEIKKERETFDGE